MDRYKEIGRKIKTARDERGLTQKDLGIALNCSEQAIGNYETGRRKISVEDIEKISKFLNKPVSYFLGNQPAEEFGSIKKNKNFLRGETSTIESALIPFLHIVLPKTPSAIPIYQVELTEVLDNENVQITEDGEPLKKEKRKRLIEAIQSPGKNISNPTIPLLGNIRAGIPLLSEQNIIGHIDIPTDMVGKADFALSVQGDSMIGAGINTGDVTVCKEDHEAVTGQIVVALVNNDETTLKYYFREDGRALLKAANPDYKDIEFKPGDIIQGHVVKILKDPPPVNTYREYICLKEGHLQEWNKVIEQAVASGIKPAVIRELLEAQVEIAKRLAGK